MIQIFKQGPNVTKKKKKEAADPGGGFDQK